MKSIFAIKNNQNFQTFGVKNVTFLKMDLLQFVADRRWSTCNGAKACEWHQYICELLSFYSFVKYFSIWSLSETSLGSYIWWQAKLRSTIGEKASNAKNLTQDILNSTVTVLWKYNLRCTLGVFVFQNFFWPKSTFSAKIANPDWSISSIQ